MYPNLYLLDVFLTVVEEGSFKKAGEKLLLTSSAISSYMRALEKSIGKSLFEQRKGGILLTNDGMLVQEYAQRFRQLQDEFSAISGNDTKKREHIMIGGGMVSGCYLLPKMLSAFQEEADNDFHFSLIVLNSLDIIKGIYDNTLNLGIILGGDDLPPDLQYRSLYKDRFVLAAAPSFLSSFRHPIRIEDLKDLPLVLSPLSKTRSTRQQLAHFRKLELNIAPKFEVYNPVAAKEIVKTGHYVGYLLLSTIREELKRQELVEVKLDEMNLAAEYGIIWKGALSPGAKKLLRFILEFDLRQLET